MNQLHGSASPSAPEGPWEPDVVAHPIDDLAGRIDQALVRHLLKLAGIDTAVKQFGILVLAAQHVEDRESVHEPIFQLFDLVEEHDRTGAAIAVD